MSSFSPQQVKEYYNKMTASYLSIYGDVIQAFRPTDTVKLLDYIGRSAGINWNLRVLDLGCGVGGPAIHFAKRWNAYVDGVTISEVQQKAGIVKVEQEQLQHKTHLHLGDYHHLENVALKNDAYDVVLFLESLGHSNDVQTAIFQASQKLKKNGVLYIKDFYKKKVTDVIEQQKIDKIIGNINQHYSYNTLDLDELKSAIATVGLSIEFIKPFDFMDDITVRYNFEKENQLDIFEGQNIHPADWLEIKCIKN
jgi:cyclopropane fatty-acyl-phospholipid synthase-like methyltransferase